MAPVDAIDSQTQNVPFANSFIVWLTHILPYPSIRCIDRFHRFVLFLFFLSRKSVCDWRQNIPMRPSASFFVHYKRFRSFTIECLRNAFAILISRTTILYCKVNSRSFGDLFFPKQQVRCIIVAYNTENRLILYIDNFCMKLI